MGFVEITVKRKKKATRHSLPVAASSFEVFVCQSLDGLRLTRESCGKIFSKERANGSSISRCRGCRVGRAHSQGRTPLAWDDGEPIEVRTISIIARSASV
jgi:hypothetical protein